MLLVLGDMLFSGNNIELGCKVLNSKSFLFRVISLPTKETSNSDRDRQMYAFYYDMLASNTALDHGDWGSPLKSSFFA
jgi:hypothetical protein